MWWLRLGIAGSLALASAAVFIVLFVLNSSGTMHDLDRTVFLELRDQRSPWLDAVGAFDDVAFRALPTFAIAIAIAAALRLLGQPRSWSAPLFIGLTAIIEFLARHSFPAGFRWGELAAAAQELLGGHYRPTAPFPSGHVARAIFLAVVAWQFLPRPIGIGMTVLATTTLFARLYTEAHRLSDVAGGLALGLSIGCTSVWWVASRRPSDG